MKKLIVWSVCFVLGGSLLAEVANDASDKKSAAPSIPAAAAPPLQLVLQLSDGSRIIGTPSIDRFKIATQYSDMEILLSRLRTVEFTGAERAAQVSLQNGDQLKGKLATTEISVTTLFGKFTISLAMVRKMRVGSPGRDLPEGCVLEYTFDTDEGGQVTDLSDAGNHGKVHGAACTSEGKISGAMSFSADGDAVIVGNPESLHLQDFTIMAWIKRGSTDIVSNTTEYGEIFGYGSGGYVMGIHKDGYIYLSQADMQIGAVSSFQIHDKDFHHVAVTKEGNKLVFYLDGVAYPADNYDGDGDFVFNTDAAVGSRSDAPEKTFIGVIDELAVFKRPLSEEEIKKVYESQK